MYYLLTHSKLLWLYCLRRVPFLC